MLDGIKKSMNKLNKQYENGETIAGNIEFIENRGKENRYTYRYLNQTVFTFGYTRGSKKNEIPIRWVPRQMGLTNAEYNKLYDCSLSKKEYNSLMITRGKIRYS